MEVREIMSAPVIGVTEDATVDEAARLMMDRGFTSLPVFTASGSLVGVVTEPDLGGALFVPDTGSQPEDGVTVGVIPPRVRQVMRKPALVISAEANLAELATAMIESHQRCLPVVDGSRVIGVVSWRDLLTNFAQDWYIPPASRGRSA
jgi:CBS domain-containing protein